MRLRDIAGVQTAAGRPVQQLEVAKFFRKGDRYSQSHNLIDRLCHVSRGRANLS